MKKLLVFSIFLICSLVTLASSFVPLNIFSNTAMAQEYNNYGDSYSKYPTDDKKYKCRTGPFEGFFVTSVEFCKFRFDDSKRDNRTGTQGPPGPQALQVQQVHKVSKGNQVLKALMGHKVRQVLIYYCL